VKQSLIDLLRDPPAPDTRSTAEVANDIIEGLAAILEG
jgi:hypothetical protein